MKVALVGAELEENLGLRYLHASIEKAGHQARIFDFHSPMQIHQIVEKIVSYGPEVVGLSLVFTGRAREFVTLAKELRRAGFCGHITAGGHFASFHAHELLRDHSALDSVIHGEGEEAIVDLIGNLAAPASVLGITHRDSAGRTATTSPRPNPDDLDSRPFPTRPSSFPAYLGQPIANILSSRGCYANCHFCSIRAWYRQNPGKQFRQREVGCVATEMAQLYHERSVRIFNFHDDNFFLPETQHNVERFLSLQRQLRKERVGRIAIQVKARPDCVHLRTMSALKNVGLFRVFLGVESNAAAGLKTLGRGIKREQNHIALKMLRNLHLHVTFNLLMFDPEATLADLADNLAFIRQYADVPLNFGRAEVYSGTPLAERLRSEGRLLGDYFGYSYRIADDRAQRAFEIFHKVFLPRNFEDGALNFEAMRLDYYYHILRHFFPDRAGIGLQKRVKGLIAELNLNSAAILGQICAFAATDKSADEMALTRFATKMASRRETFDGEMRLRMEDTIEEIEALACPRVRRNRKRLSRAAAVAAAVLIITATGCSGHGQPDKKPPPATLIQKMANVRDLTVEEVEAVKQRIKEQYEPALIADAKRGGFVNHPARIDLIIASGGWMRNWEISVPQGFETSAFKTTWSNQIQGWSFPFIKHEGKCSVRFELPARQLIAGEVRMVKKRIKEQYENTLVNHARTYGFVDQRMTMDLILNATGNVDGLRLLMPKGWEKSGMQSVVHAYALKWSFPSLKEAGTCTITLELVRTPLLEQIKNRIDKWRGRRGTHFTEIMMVPMMPTSPPRAGQGSTQK
jgi:radical SAM superfamily enzyme YgiQ (UPF0313 family)